MARRPVQVHRFQARLFPVNAYLVETPSAVVCVDATLGGSDARALRTHADALGKPLAGVLVTHSHPDHYGGLATLVSGRDVPVYAVAGVDRVIRRDDAAKEQILRPMFGDEWVAVRSFPNRVVRAGERPTVGDAVFRVVDAGPCESPHDSWWVLDDDGPPCAFVGDLVYSRMRAYLADGDYEEWLACLARARRELPRDATLFMGHGFGSGNSRLANGVHSPISRYGANRHRRRARRRCARGSRGESDAGLSAERRIAFPPALERGAICERLWAASR